MVENELTKALRAWIAEAVKDFVLPVKKGEVRAPTVLNGYLPPKRTGTADDFPFVLVRADSGTANEEATEVKVVVIIGCYAEDFDGHEYCMNVMSRIRTALCAMPLQTLARRYQLRMPILWNTYATQPWPQWQLDMETTWLIRTPQPVSLQEEF